MKKFISSVVTAALLALIVVPVMPAYSAGYNYGEALQKAIMFYEAEQSGKLPSWNRVEWRGDAALEDGSDVGRDLTGGWFDAGDHVKFGFPMAASTTTLAWGAIEFWEGYEKSSQVNHFLQNLRFVNDYFIKCHVISGGATSEFYGQIGKGADDHSFWGSPEVMTMARPAYSVSPSKPGSELAAETAAAMASSSIVFRSHDREYADTLLYHARLLFDFADKYRGAYDQSITDVVAFYRSFNGYIDDLGWGAYWLYRAEECVKPGSGSAYLAESEAFYAEYIKLLGTTPEHREYNWTHNWNDKYFGLSVLLAKATGKAVYREKAERNLDWWTVGVDGKKIKYTPGGLAYLDKWGALRYASNAALLAFVYSDWVDDPVLKERYHSFAVSQMNYILGDNPNNMSYLIGFGEKWPQNPHHRGAHGSWTANIQSPENNRHVLIGALVGGPADTDVFADSREDYVTCEVACDYNAGFTGALARMVMEFGGTPLDDSVFPQPEERDDLELFVEAAAGTGGTWGCQPILKVVNKTSWPPRVTTNLSVKYFFDLDGQSPSDITAKSSNSDFGGTIEGPFQWSGNTYYFLIDLTGARLAPGGYNDYARNIYLTINDRSSSMDTSNDWSAQGLTSSMSRAQNVALYDNGVKVFGKEPGEPSVSPTPTIVPTATPSVVPSPLVKAGDLNFDGSVDSTDLTLMKRYILKILTFSSTEEKARFEKAADVNGDGSVDSTDLTFMKRRVLKIIDKFPVEM